MRINVRGKVFPELFAVAPAVIVPNPLRAVRRIGPRAGIAFAPHGIDGSVQQFPIHQERGAVEIHHAGVRAENIGAGHMKLLLTDSLYLKRIP
jgi:hypothetical protein